MGNRAGKLVCSFLVLLCSHTLICKTDDFYVDEVGGLLLDIGHALQFALLDLRQFVIPSYPFCLGWKLEA